MVLRPRLLVLSLGCWGVSAAIGCSDTNNDFFEGLGARSGGSGALAGNGGTAGIPFEARGGARSGGSGEGGSGARARGGSAASQDAGNGGDAGDGEAGARVHSSGGAPPDGQGGSANAGDANAGGDESAGGDNANDAGHGGRTSGEGGGGRANGSGGDVATSGSAGDGGASLGGRDGTGGAPAGGGVPGVAGVTGEDAGAAGRENAGGGGQGGVCDDTERCDGIDNDCKAGIDEGGVCPESCRGFDLDGRAYMFCTGAGGHFASAEICEQAAMDLVRIDSASENAGVLAAVQRLGEDAPPGSVHIGATDFGSSNEGNFRWPDGAVFWIGAASGSAVNGAYTHWDEGEPNNYETNEDCVEMLVAALAEKAGLWNDVRCSSTLSFVCEE